MATFSEAKLYPLGTARRAIRDVLRMELPDKVTIIDVGHYPDPEAMKAEWAVRFMLPGRDDILTVRAEHKRLEVFPYEEILTKIRMFL